MRLKNIFLSLLSATALLCTGASASVKTFCYFSIGIIGDGSHSSVTLNFNTDPFVVSSFGSVPGQAPQLSPTFLLSTSLPTSVGDLQSSDSQTLTGSIGLLGAVTFTWPTAIPNGDKVTIYGTMRF